MTLTGRPDASGSWECRCEIVAKVRRRDERLSGCGELRGSPLDRSTAGRDERRGGAMWREPAAWMPHRQPGA